MALKLDMSKAYDRVEWLFLERVLFKLGFAKKIVDLVMLCVKTVHYSILLNGGAACLLPARERYPTGGSSITLFVLVLYGGV